MANLMSSYGIFEKVAQEGTEIEKGIIMTRDEQAAFVRELSINITAKILSDIEDGKVPEDWDGHELRQLLAERFDNKHFWLMMSLRRRREYENIVSANNL